jgi:hypothetical protein
MAGLLSSGFRRYGGILGRFGDDLWKYPLE